MKNCVWCFDVSFIANAIDAVGRGRGRRRRRLRLRLRHRRRREHALFCSRPYNICRVHKLLSWWIQEGITVQLVQSKPLQAGDRIPEFTLKLHMLASAAG